MSKCKTVQDENKIKQLTVKRKHGSQGIEKRELTPSKLGVAKSEVSVKVETVTA